VYYSIISKSAEINNYFKETSIMEKLRKAQSIAIIATLVSLVGLIVLAAGATTAGEGILIVGVGAGIASYVYGGFKTAVKMSGKLAKIGWFVVPFPYDIFTLIITFFFAIFMFVCIPIIPIRKAYKESLKYEY
jgi:hypothetical protein